MQFVVENLVNLVNRTPAVVLVVFVLSFLANVFQIISFLRENRRLKQEQAQLKEERELRKSLAQTVATYEFILQRADKNIRTESELEDVEKEISTKESVAQELSNRTDYLRFSENDREGDQKSRVERHERAARN